MGENMFVDLGGKRAFVTGGSRGVGRATAVLLACQGADVVISYRTRGEAAAEVVREIQAMGRRASAVGGDLAERAEAERSVDEAVAYLGGLDILVANAGVWPPVDVPLAALSEERWRHTHRVNLDSVFFTIRRALESLGEGGRIVIVSSTAGQRGEAMHADYASTKGALISLTKSLCVELAPSMTVNCVAPGWIDTEMSETAYVDGGLQAIASGIPTQRVASAEDVAGPIVFLCSEWARQINGEILNINGGSILCG